MTLNLTVPQQDELKPRITVFGVGGAGGNAVNNMISKQLEGVEFVVANTDAQALKKSAAVEQVQIGLKVTEGLGAGANPSIGAAAAEESIETIVDHLAGAHMCFITAGMGGGTGTGAAPIIAQAARELGVLTVGVVTKPFQFEGTKRMRQAEEGVEQLQKMVDTLIVIPNQNLFRVANESTTFAEAFAIADDVLYQGVKGVTDLMVRPGLINLDFADVRSVMDEMGKAMMGTGEGDGEGRALEAAERAIANPLLDEVSLEGARGVLINITGGEDLTLFEVDEAANQIRKHVDPDAKIIVGSTLVPEMEGVMRVSVVATGIDAGEADLSIPAPRRAVADAVAKPAAQAVTQTAAQTDDAPAEPGFFDRFDNVSDEDTRESWAEDHDDVPAPAYRPTSVQEEAALPEEPVAAQFTAPKRVPVGTPSPEAMARLKAAVDRQPGAAAQAPARAQGETHANVDRPRFGFNQLLNRIASSADDEVQEDLPTPPARHHAPQIRAQAVPAPRPVAPEYTHEDERIEVPAFLRRQAN